MSASTELEALANLDEVDHGKRDTKRLIEDIDEQIKTNLINQFGLSQMLGEFKDGGGVDTIHNVRHGVYSSRTVEKELTQQTTGYNQKIAKEFHGKSERYREINKHQTKQQKAGNLYDVNTGQKLGRNKKTDLDHTISTKEVYEDKGRALAGKSVDELANTDSNLHLTDRSINRSMGAKNKTDYANDLSRKKEIWEDERKRILKDEALTSGKKRSKRKNIKNRMQADATEIKRNDRVARKSYEKEVNEYYRSSKFKKSTLKNGAKKGFSNAKAQIIGTIILQIEGALFRSIKHTIALWHSFSTMKARFDDFISRIKIELKDIKKRLSKIKDAAISGFTGGFMSAVGNTIINIFVTTSGSFARILSSAFTSLIQAVKILFDKTAPFAQRFAQAMKLISTAVMAALGVILSESLSKAIAVHVPFLAPISDILAKAISAIVMGVLTALIIYSIDNLKAVVAKVKETFQTFMIGLTVAPETIRDNYKRSIAHIDAVYQEVLQSIYQHYSETERLQKLAYDLDLPTADQFVASVDLARSTGVAEEKILKNNTDVMNYFNS